MNKAILSVLGIGILALMLFASLTSSSTVDSVRGKPLTSDSSNNLTDTSGTVVRAPGADGIVNKYAVIVGISDYMAISDLSFCDEDANDWFYQLDAMGYTIKLFGDHSNAYAQYDGRASELNVKTALSNFMVTADADDILVFASSGHGSYVRSGKTRYQYLCMWDMSYTDGDSQDGKFMDSELKTVFAAATCKWFIFLDHCFSGGMNEVMTNANKANGILTTTCTALGYGYDMPEYNNGAWTYIFLEYSWQGHFGGSASTSMESVWGYAFPAYPFDKNDAPQFFDGNTAAQFYL